MTIPQENQPIENASQPKVSDKELNFRALQAKYEKQLAEEKAARSEAEKKLLEKVNAKVDEDDDEDDEPYVVKKKLEKKLNRFGQNTQSEIQKAMEMAKVSAKEELKQEMWMENNPDFYDVLQHAEKFAQKAPKLAETILRMPEGFERQKLVYENIKAMGIDKPEQKTSSVQEKIDQNRKGPYYQPASVGAPPYAMQGDFSPAGQKKAYEKLKELKNNLRI